MNTQPIDPRALKAAEEINKRIDELCCLDNEEIARIIQSHFAESVDGKLLEECLPYLDYYLKQNLHSLKGASPDEIFYGEDICTAPLINKVKRAIALAKSQPPSMADELAEALREVINGALHPEKALRRVMVDLRPIRELLARYDAQKGQP